MRSGLPANSDPAFSGIRLSTDRFIGHVRYASDPSTVNDGNSHPFLYSGIALAHNGTFRGAIGEEASRRKASDTLVFLERLSARWKERTIAGLKESLDEMLGDAGLVGDYSAANLLISCGESLFALRRCRRDEDYYTLYMRTAPGLAVAASEKLDGDPGWRLLENGELVDMRLPEPRFGHLRASA
jgi:predicted glutamine amidotransferase